MSDSASGFRRLGRLTLRTCVRGLVIAVLSVVPGIPLFIAAIISLPLLAVGIGVIPVPMSLLAVRRRAAQQRRLALEWSRVSIATPYRPRPHEVSNGLIGRLQRCKWLLTDPATWRDLLWTLVNMPVGVALGTLPAFGIVAGAVGLLSGVWLNPGHLKQLPLFLGLLLVGVFAGPRMLKTHAQFSAALLAPTRKELDAQVGRLNESRSQVVDASAAELRRIERDLHDGAQARLVSLGMSIGLAEQVLRDDPDLALKLLAEARAVQRPGPDRSAPPGPRNPPAGAGRTRPRRCGPGARADPPAARGAAHRAARPATGPGGVRRLLRRRRGTGQRGQAQRGARVPGCSSSTSQGRLIAIVGDDGTGGAVPRIGGGLRGIDRRLAAFDGVIAVTSPVGGPTVVTMELPCELSLART